MDRGYVNFERLFTLTLSLAFFVVRTKSNVLLQRRYSHPVDKRRGVRSDQTVILSSFESASVYPEGACLRTAVRQQRHLFSPESRIA
jgi:hypothetical protein